MKVKGKYYRTIWTKQGDNKIIQIIDQRNLPHEFIIEDLTTVDQVAEAIRDMHVRGAGLIGATASYGIYLAIKQRNEKEVCYIQELLEHNSSINFEIYTRIIYAGIKNVNIPLDYLTDV